MQPPKRKVGQDVIKKNPVHNHRVIQGVSQNTAHKEISKNINREISSIEERFSSKVVVPKQTTPTKGGIMWVIGIILIIACAITIGSLFASATVNITLEQRNIPIAITRPVYLEPTENQLGYKTVEVVDRQTYFFPTDNQVNLQESATGKVKIFNATQNQVTIPARTVIVSSSGLQFTTQESVVIPRGSVQLPGSREVSIKAVNPGQESNIGMDDFTASSFPQVTIRSATPLEGGFVGGRAVMTEAEYNAVQSILVERMKKNQPELYIANQIPAGFVLPNGLVMTTDIEFSQDAESQGVQVVAERKITGYIFDQKSLEYYLIQQLLPEKDWENFVIHADSSQLAYQLTTDQEQQNVTITGNITVRSAVDETTIKNMVRATKIKNTSETLAVIPGLIHHVTTSTPFWGGKFPEKNSRIIINFNYLVK
jgi:hypothetical protein